MAAVSLTLILITSPPRDFPTILNELDNISTATCDIAIVCDALIYKEKVMCLLDINGMQFIIMVLE